MNSDQDLLDHVDIRRERAHDTTDEKRALAHTPDIGGHRTADEPMLAVTRGDLEYVLAYGIRR